VLDADGARNTIDLGMGLEFADVEARRSGNDLTLGLKGVRNVDFTKLDTEFLGGNTTFEDQAAPSGLTIQGYYSGTASWQIRTSDGSMLSISAWEQLTQPTAANWTQQAYRDWQTSVVSAWFGDSNRQRNWNALQIAPYSYSGINSDGRSRFTLGVEFASSTSDAGVIERTSNMFADTDGNATSNLIIETLDAGPSANVIYLDGIAVRAGDGNDFINGRVDYGAYKPVGSFIDAGNGDDRVWGSLDNDVILAGNGNDYLMGSDGDDSYLISAADTGIKVIDEITATVALPDGSQSYWAGGSYSIDTVEFGPGISLYDLDIRRGKLYSSDVPNMSLSSLPWSGYADTLDFTWGDGQQTVRVMLPAQPSAWPGGYGVEFFKFADGTRLDMGQMLSFAPTIVGTQGNDVLFGTTGADYIAGLGGNDHLSPREGDDTLAGGPGNDTLYGGTGSDTYIFRRGDGSDYILDQGNISDTDTLRFGSGIAPTDMTISYEGAGWRFSIRDTQDSVLVDGAENYPLDKIERVLFADGTVWNSSEIEQRLIYLGTAGNDSLIVGNNKDAVMRGLAGNDSLIGGPGNDLLDGGPGNDRLNGDAGNDTYEFNPGDGNDIITDYSGINTLRFGPGIQADDLDGYYQYLYGSDGWRFDIGGSGDSVQLQWDYASPSPSFVNVGRFEFADGTTWNADEIARHLVFKGTTGDDTLSSWRNFDVRLNGLAGNDTLWAFDGNDVLIGGVGDDTLYGGLGNDTYVFEAGDGQDSVSDWGGIDTITFGSGIAPVDISLTQDEQLHINVGSSGDGINVWSNQDDMKIERFTFADGTVWDAGEIESHIQITAGTDYVYGSSGDDILQGLGGDDRLMGNAGNDIYLFNKGDGQDVIADYDATPGNVDTLRFGPDISPGDVMIVRDWSWRLQSANGDSITLENAAYDAANGIERIEFADGTVWMPVDLAALATLTPATTDSDSLVGTENADAMDALAGDDEVYGLAGNDLLEGGSGYDYLEGDAGNDILRGGADDDDIEDWEGSNVLEGGAGDDYLYADGGSSFMTGGTGADYIDAWGPNSVVAFNRGDGNDVLDVGTNLTLSLGGGILPGDLMLSRAGDDFILDFGSGDAIQITRPAWLDQPAFSPITLQIVGGDVRWFDLNATIADFMQLQAQDSGIVSWNAGDALAAHALGNSNDRAYGGRLAVDYARSGSLDAMPPDAIRAVISDADFGAVPQSMVTNHAPVAVNAVADQLAAEDALFRFAVPADTFSDIDAGDTLRYSATLSDGSALPSWLAFDEATRSFSGTPVNADVGSLSLTLTVTDQAGERVASTFAVVIANVNDAPVVANAIQDLAATEDATFSFVVPADAFADIDAGDSLGYAATREDGSALPSWLSFDAVTRAFSGTPTNSDVGSLSITVKATDVAGASVSQQFSMAVANVNDAPTGTVGVGGTAIQGQTLTASNTLADIDGLGSIGYQWQSSTDGTTWSAISGATAGSFTLGAAQVGQQVRVNASYTDGHGTAESVASSATAAIVGVNNAPTLAAALVDQNATEDAVFAFTVPTDTFADIDAGDTLSYAATQTNGAALPAWLAFDAATRSFSGTPTSTAAGLMNVRVTATDLAGASVSDDFVLDVANHIVGTTAANSLVGTALRDVIEGLDGNDTLNGGIGTDTLIGGLGNDIYVVDNADDVVIENAGEGTDTVQSSISYTLGADLENLTLTGTAAIDGTGNDLNNVLVGNTAANTLSGGAGNDTLNGGTGADTLIGRLGNDIYVVDNIGDVVIENAGEGIDTVQSYLSYTLGANLENLTLLGTAAISGTGNELNNVIVGNAAANILDGGLGNDSISGGASGDTLIGGDGNDVLNGGLGADTMIGAIGNDTYYVDDANDTITEFAGEGTDRVISTASVVLGDAVENLTLSGTAAINGTGNALNNIIVGNAAANTLDGVAGDDSITGGASADTLIGGDGNDLLNGGLGADTMIGGTGNDTYTVDDAGDAIIELAGEGLDVVNSSVSYTLSANIERLTLSGTASIDGTGNEEDNLLTGNAAANVLSGGAGNDTLNGAAGADTLIGGLGDDIYTVDNVGDVIVEAADEGVDQVNASVIYTLSDDVDNLTLTGSAALNATGNAQNNVLTGNAAANTLDGGGGADTLIGGIGNDIYVVDNAADVVIENAAQGTDTVQSSVSYALGANQENLTLIGTDAIDGTGNELSNVLTGNAAANILSGGLGNDTLNGGAGADTLIGGLGNDIYVLDDAADVSIENAAEGTDLVQSTVSYTLGANVENLTLLGMDAIDGTGNELNNVLTGNAAANTLSGGIGNDTLNGGAGADTLIGGVGNDIYVVDDAADVTIENAAEGTDLVQSTVSYMLGANVENLTLLGTAAINGSGNELNNVLTGNAGANTLSGGIGNDTLNGGAGADTLVGGLGNDIYVVDNAGDVAIENAGEGTDTVRSYLTYTLGADLENLALLGAVAIDGSGNELNNVMTGNAAANKLTGGAGNDTLNGGVGADTLIGGLGNDVYTVDNAGDAVVEAADEGVDQVNASVSYALADNVENLTLAGTAATTGTGNALGNVLIGNAAANILDGGAGNDTLNGGAGADTLIGGQGNDIFVVDNVGDVVTEDVGEGTDTVQSSIAYALAADLENLTLTGTATIDGTGNAMDNVIVGNSAANRLTGLDGNDWLDGGAGNDTLVGGTGDDTYVVAQTADVVAENASEGTDTVRSSISWTLGANLENLVLTGTSAISGTGNGQDNTITGNGANNNLNGGAGADTLIGGLGNDTYTVDDIGDVAVENAGEGTDIVNSSVGYTLAANVENLTLTGTLAIDGTGNALDNLLTGNAAANVLSGGAGYDTLNGGAGADTLIGGDGNDTYIVDNAGDVVTENASEGIDLVRSSITHTLAAEVENLLLTGGNINGTGNTLDNVITGSTSNNTLTGNAGNDTLDGKTGTDILVGGTGNDTYLFGAGYGSDTIRENDATADNNDAAQFLAGIAADQIWLRHVGNKLEASIIGTTDKLTLENWYLGSAYHVELFKTADGKLLLDSQVENLVQAMAAFAPPSAGQTTLPPTYQDSLAPVIAANWQ